ncbi:hypothetical protein AMD27_17615 (plasmid) [Acinetobacter sp. TGL-Y2]|nr:hypothetical protein AMD27_17615 [Acinetobacter sp. TGL-Y2]
MIFNIFKRNILVIILSIILFIIYEFSVFQYLSDVTNPIFLTRTFQFLLVFSFYYIFKNKYSTFSFKLLEITTTLLIFITAVYVATIMKYILSSMIGEISNEPELVLFFGSDFIDLINNKYFGYSSYFISSVGILRILLYKKITNYLYNHCLNESDKINTCPSCNQNISEPNKII